MKYDLLAEQLEHIVESNRVLADEVLKLTEAVNRVARILEDVHEPCKQVNNEREL
jgi:hypothetical protein